MAADKDVTAVSIKKEKLELPKAKKASDSSRLFE
jgi:hypothetical protein